MSPFCWHKEGGNNVVTRRRRKRGAEAVPSSGEKEETRAKANSTVT